MRSERKQSDSRLRAYQLRWKIMATKIEFVIVHRRAIRAKSCLLQSRQKHVAKLIQRCAFVIACFAVVTLRVSTSAKMDERTDGRMDGWVDGRNTFLNQLNTTLLRSDASRNSLRVITVLRRSVYELTHRECRLYCKCGGCYRCARSRTRIVSDSLQIPIYAND